MTHKQILGGRGSAKPFTTLNSIKLKLELDQLKAENEELKVYKSITPLKTKMLVKALTEIKDYCNKYPQNSIGFKQQILQKCEVLDE